VGGRSAKVDGGMQKVSISQNKGWFWGGGAASDAMAAVRPHRGGRPEPS